MNESLPLVLELSRCDGPELVGGKALNLARLIQAGLPVPGGFCVTTEAYRQAHASGAARMTAEIEQAIRGAYRQVGSPSVAVRSSATAEDMAEASMAGQYETYLDVQGEEALLEAVGKCWASIDSARTRTYLKEHGIDLSKVAMAVVVQELVPSEVAGVLFTANPQTGRRDEMLIEASWGLGEAVVSGLVQPDTYTVETSSRKVVHSVIADKHVWIRPGGGHEETEVEPERRTAACLGDREIAELLDLGEKCQAHFGRPQDIEWGIHEGKAYLLQSRPITSLRHAEALCEALRAVKAELHHHAAQGRGPWVIHNLAETLPLPTPLTWSVTKRFMSGAGGFGEMYRQAGFQPSARVCEEGFLQLIAGRIYMDCSLSPEMFFEKYPFRYDLSLLRCNPDASQQPPTLPAGSLRAKLRGARRIGRSQKRLEEIAGQFDNTLNAQIIPAFTEWSARERRKDLSGLSAQELADLWRQRDRKVMDEFAPQSLVPSLIGGFAIAELQLLLEEHFWDRDSNDLVNELATDDEPDKTVAANIALYEVVVGRRTLQQWLDEHGHRAPEEFDLASPRWRENPDELMRMASHLKGGADPAEIQRHRSANAEKVLEELSAELSPADSAELRRRVDLVRRYMPFRENAKYYLMLGYELLRQVAVEVGRRLGLGDGVFLLTEQEMLDSLASGKVTVDSDTLAQRRIEREAHRRISLLPVIAAEDIDSLGEPPETQGATRLSAFAVSAGSAKGSVRVVLSPTEAGDLGKGYVLVCPSTDPAWTPLFVNACALVLERGGTLSHGAVVAREMGIPAVVLPDATKLLRGGEPVTIDGHRGAVLRAGAERVAEPTGPGPDDVRLRSNSLPPPSTRWERRIGKIRNIALLVWAAFLAAAFIFPDEIYWPTIDLADKLFWPLVPAVGVIWTTAIISAVMAVIIMAVQWLLADNKALRLGRKRANALRKQVSRIDAKAPRRKAVLRATAPLQTRILGAAMIPLGLLLGPLMFVFFWLADRAAPEKWPAEAGTGVTVTATLSPGCREPVRLRIAEPLEIDKDSPNPAVAPPISETLRELRRAIEAREDLTHLGRVQERLEQDRQEVLSSLDEYLAESPGVGVSWRLIVPPDTTGRFPVKVSVAEHWLDLNIVLGIEHPPAPQENLGEGDSPIRSLKITYAKTGTKPEFLKPFASLGWNWDIGWLGLYLVVYIPAMFLVKWALRVP